MVAPRVYHGEYTLQETVILTQLNLNMQARDLERMVDVRLTHLDGLAIAGQTDVHKLFIGLQILQGRHYVGMEP